MRSWCSTPRMRFRRALETSSLRAWGGGEGGWRSGRGAHGAWGCMELHAGLHASRMRSGSVNGVKCVGQQEHSHDDRDIWQLADALGAVEGVLHELAHGGVEALAGLWVRVCLGGGGLSGLGGLGGLVALCVGACLDSPHSATPAHRMDLSSLHPRIGRGDSNSGPRAHAAKAAGGANAPRKNARCRNRRCSCCRQRTLQGSSVAAHPASSTPLGPLLLAIRSSGACYKLGQITRFS